MVNLFYIKSVLDAAAVVSSCYAKADNAAIVMGWMATKPCKTHVIAPGVFKKTYTYATMD